MSITLDGTTVTFYINGAQDSQHAHDVVLGGGDNAQPFRFGGYSVNGSSWPFNGKMDEVRYGGRHDEKAFEMLKKHPKIALIVKKHNLDGILAGELNTWEEKIVFYADKRVNGSKAVTLEQRFSYLKRRYGSRSKELMGIIQKAEPLVYKLEKEMFSRIRAKPEDIVNHLK